MKVVTKTLTKGNSFKEALFNMEHILMFSHGSGLSGAEIALLNHAKILINQGHTVTLATPNKGPLNDQAQSLGIQSLTHDYTWITHQPLECFFRLNTTKSLHLLQEKFEKLSSKPTLICSNTICIIDGAILAARNNIPHIWSVHEVIPNEQSKFDLSPFQSVTLKQWIKQLSDQIIFCSPGALASFDKSLDPAKTTIIAPYIHQKNRLNSHTAKDPYRLYFIGSLTERKNPVFALNVLFILRNMGIDINLYFIGPKTSYISTLLNIVSRRKLKKHVFFTNQVSNPYSYVHGKAINLICSENEPFGLTIPESLSRGIPTISSCTEGPRDLLSPEHLYALNDHGECCQKIIQTINQYDDEVKKALDKYQKLSGQFKENYLSTQWSHAIELAKNNFSTKKIPENLINPKLISSAKLMNQSIEQIAENFFGQDKSNVQNFNEALINEKKYTGFNVNLDCKKYGVIKYCATKEMDTLYKEGKSFAIELLAHHDSIVRQKIFAYICILLEEKYSREKIKVLSIGDGIGLDSIRLALQGHHVDYLDIDESITAKFALSIMTHFKKAISEAGGQINIIKEISNQSPYDSIICLEVLEHVRNPENLVTEISKSLKDDGLLFISECFEGVEENWPTHLIENEKYTGYLPEICHRNGLKLYSYNRIPFGKPYVFISGKSSNIHESWLNDKKLLKKYYDYHLPMKFKKINRIKQLTNKLKLYFGLV